MPFGGALTVGLIGAGSSIFNGILGNSAAKNAAAAQAAAANKAVDATNANTTNANANVYDLYNGASQTLDPYQQTGAWANSSLQALMQPGGTLSGDKFKFDPATDPGYQFRLQQGLDATAQGQYASGLGGSGGALKSLQRYAQDYASNEYQNAFNRDQTEKTNIFNRFNTVSGSGQAAANSLGTLAAGEAGQLSNNLNTNSQLVGNDITGAGNATASGIIGGANALGGAATGISNAAQSALLMQLLNQSNTKNNGSVNI